ncbi:MAG: o-succinylbenzoate--CoA ligase [Bdellovibrionales bacterium]|nr:o-succinylbenzoate--CoA ligase [Bdellovibrionales bacterium]
MSQANSIEIDWLKKWNQYSPNKTAFVDVPSGQSYSYSEFFKISNAFAKLLSDKGVGQGDRIAVLAQNRIETVFLFFALQRLGAIIVPINFRLSAPEVDYILQDSGSKMLFVGPELEEKGAQCSSAIEKLPLQWFTKNLESARTWSGVVEMQAEFESPCQILYTSGTTGFPKGVVITHKVLFWNSINTSISLKVSDEDCMVSFLPLFHTGGWNVLLTPFIHKGAKTVFLPTFDADAVLEWSEREKATLLFGVPTTLTMMAKSDSFARVDLSSVRYAVVGGEPMPLGMIQRWHQKGVSMRQGFGLTECGPNCFSLSEQDAETKIGSIGRPNFYVETKIVDEQDQEVAIGEVGELLLKGPMCMPEYWGQPEATRLAFWGKWLRTGDLVKRDEDDYFYVVGRKKEMFISGGENVYPAEIEKVLTQHSAIDEVAVVGYPDEKWGEVGKAFIVSSSVNSLNKDEIGEFCMQRLAKFKIPKHIEFVEELPKGATGKILKKKLMQIGVTTKAASASV